MRTKTATVDVDPWTGVARLPTGVRLDSPAWFAWLAAPATNSFAYPVFNPAQGYIEGFLSVRKERRTRGDVYWTAYCHLGGRLRKAYLGRSERVTDARLAAVAATMLAHTRPAPRPASPLPSRHHAHDAAD